MTLPCTAQCNIEILRVALLRLQPVKGHLPSPRLLLASQQLEGRHFTLNLSQRHPPCRSDCLPRAFQQACVAITVAHLCPPRLPRGKTRSYSPLLQEALRARFTLVCEIEHRDQGSYVDASETCNSAAQNPNRHTQVDMPGDPRQWWVGTLGCL